MTDKIDKSFVGKYVCYAKPDGSFTWGRIKDQGFVRSTKGEQEVFILTDQITCRVANNELELATIRRLGTLIAEGKAGPSLLPGPTDPSTLPSYQRFGERRQIAAGADGEAKRLTEGEPFDMVKLLKPEPNQGMVPAAYNGTEAVSSLRDERHKSRGLRIQQKVGCVVSSVDGHEINFILRRYGYDTNVRRASLNLETDIIDPDNPRFQGMLDGEVFLLAMQSRLAGVSLGEIFGRKELGA